MTFKPENRLEEIMLLAASQAETRPRFYRALMEAELIVPGTAGETLLIETVSHEGKPYHPVFTSKTRLRAFSEEPVQHFTITGRVLFEVARGASFVINPRSDMGKLLVPEEIEYWLEQLRDEKAGGRLVAGQPGVRPKKLIKALCVLFMSRSLVRAAHLVYVAREGSRLPAHPLIGIVAEGDTAKLAREIFEAAKAAMPKTAIDVMVLDEKNPKLPLEKHLLSVAPFYKRTVDLTSN
jgi:hypothetical protein